MYITINHLDDYMNRVKVGDELSLRPDPDNPYDDEALKVMDAKGTQVGWVANSVCTVARGTYSAGRVYDQLQNMPRCKVLFILDDRAIAEIF
ncbi:MAG TPA: hypothetical protein DCG37_06160 [Lachnospiraceae bacterium]|nr:hypothetical protein [Lachnospiraceae bacterium]